MKVLLLLADAAQTVDGKLYILGGGWSITGPGPAQMAIVMKFEVPWDQANRSHRWTLMLVTTDGKPVELPVADGSAVGTIEVSGQFEVGRPPALARGTTLDVPVTINLGPLPLPPGERYEWRLTVDDESREDWRLAFQTRPAVEPAG
ncbi:MAG: DUF6941 family protein [Egibacteraceae bacterium]